LEDGPVLDEEDWDWAVVDDLARNGAELTQAEPCSVPARDDHRRGGLLGCDAQDGAGSSVRGLDRERFRGESIAQRDVGALLGDGGGVTLGCDVDLFDRLASFDLDGRCVNPL